MKNLIVLLTLALVLALGAVQSAGAALVWQHVTEISTGTTTRLYTHNDTLYCGTGPLVYRFDRQANRWDTLAELDPEVTLIAAIIKIGDRLFVGTYNKGVFESDDNGVSWSPRNTGLNGLSSKAIVDFTSRGDSLYVGTSGAGVFVMNLNTPPNWVSYADGMPDNLAANVLSLYDFDNYLLAGAGLNSTLYRNAPDTNGWEEYPFSVFDPRGAGMLDMTSLGDLIYGVTGNGLYISRDSGATWERYRVTNFLIGSGSVAADKDAVYGSIWLPIFGSFYFSSTGAGWQLLDSVQSRLTYNLEILEGRLYAGRDDGLWFAQLNSTDAGGGDPTVPSAYALAQNYPNPFNPTTTIEYSVPARTTVTLEIFNMLGQRVRTLVNGSNSAGSYRLEWTGTDDADRPVSTGVYLYRFSAGDVVETKKMLLLK